MKSYFFFKFGLIVTGKGEKEHIERLFASLMATGTCHFEVIAFIGQRSPITSNKRIARMVGSGKEIPDKDATEIGIPARQYLSKSSCHFVILIDDIENDRRSSIQEIYTRYRIAFDTMLNEDDRKRASVHFFANMLEAYYFADVENLNNVLQIEPRIPEFKGDVEQIIHPKGELKRLYPLFNEVEHGGRILSAIDLSKILSNPSTCAWLRTLFAWCITVIESQPQFLEHNLGSKFSIPDGALSVLTKPQIEALKF
jgi:hypothetical protein